MAGKDGQRRLLCFGKRNAVPKAGNREIQLENERLKGTEI